MVTLGRPPEVYMDSSPVLPQSTCPSLQPRTPGHPLVTARGPGLKPGCTNNWWSSVKAKRDLSRWLGTAGGQWLKRWTWSPYNGPKTHGVVHSNKNQSLQGLQPEPLKNTHQVRSPISKVALCAPTSKLLILDLPGQSITPTLIQ